MTYERTTPHAPGTELYDPYFKTVVVVEKAGTWEDARFIRGRFYTVRYPDGAVMDCHESAFQEIGRMREETKS